MYILKLPEVELRDQPNSNRFEVHAKVDHPNQTLPQTFIAQSEELKHCWLQEIGQYVTDQLALHEHTVDDLRIDPTQVKPDSEGEPLRLPQRKGSYESDGIKPSEVAKDHFLSASEREIYAKQHAEEQQILLQQQQSFVQRKTQIKQSAEVSSVTETKIVQESKEVVVQNKGEEKRAQLTRSTAVENTEEIQVKGQESKQTKERKVVSIQEVTNKSAASSKTEDKPTKVPAETDINTQLGLQDKTNIEHTKNQTKQNEIKSTNARVENTKVEKTGKTDCITKAIDETKMLQGTLINDKLNQVQITSAKIINKDVMLETTAANKIITPVHTVENQLALNTKPKPAQDGGGNGQKSDNKENSSPNASNIDNRSNQLVSSATSSSQKYQTVSTFNFGDRQGPPGQPPTPNLPDFLVPPHLITYETSIEINVRKIPPPSPPPPPKFLKKLLVHTESLERKTRAFLTGNYELGTTDSSVRTARQKIRSLKSTILKSDDEVKHAEDTIHKAQSGDFSHIFNPPILDKPLYEFIEIPSERSEEECSEFSDRRSERGISEQTQNENMEEHYSSRISTRSSRRERRVEG